MSKENLTEVPEKVVAVKETPTAVKPKEQELKPEKTTEKKGEYTVEIVRDFDGNVDPFYLTKKDPNYAYRFLRDDTKTGGKNISIKTGNLLFQKGGWQLCPKEHLLRIGIKETELSPDNFLRRGDTILAFMPKTLFLEKQAQKDKEAKEVMDAIKRRANEGDPTQGGTALHPTMRGLQTKKQLGMK